jgi:hypothetical protein
LPHHPDAVKDFISEGDDLQSILAKEADHLPPTLKHWVYELRRLVKFREQHESTVDCLESGHVRFCSDGKIEYFSDTEKELFRRFLADVDAVTQHAFKSDPCH